MGGIECGRDGTDASRPLGDYDRRRNGANAASALDRLDFRLRK